MTTDSLLEFIHGKICEDKDYVLLYLIQEFANGDGYDLNVSKEPSKQRRFCT